MKRECKYSTILDKWLDEKQKSDIKIQTYQRYTYIVEKYLKNTIGKLKCHEINLNIINEFLISNDIKQLSLSVKKSILGIIKNSLEIAYASGLCEYINFKKIKFKRKRCEILVFTKSQQKRIDSYITHNINEKKLILLIAMYTGIRVGEACGLKWTDIDLDRKIISINRTIQRIQNPDKKGITKTILISSLPKSETSLRKIPIADYLIPYLTKLYKDEDVFILTGKKEHMYDVRTFEKFYRNVLKRCHIPYLKFHTLRHTFATNSIAAGVDPKTLSEILGHSSVDITLKLYVHPTFNMKKKSIEKVIKYMKN